MILWRILYKIQSSRYAGILIYPFSISTSLFICHLFKSKIRSIKIICSFIAIGILIGLINKNYNIKQINSNLGIIAELHDKYNKTWREWILITNHKDGGRIKRMEKGANNYQTYYLEQTLDDVSMFIDNYIDVSHNVLYNISLNAEDSIRVNPNRPLSKFKHILSIYSQKNKKKRNNVFSIESKASFKYLSKNKIIIPESGILKNGDLETIDSPEDSYKKFKKHIGHYELYFDLDQSKRTPVNAYFHNAPEYTQYLPYYSCLNTKAISGKNSARIITKKGIGYLLFYQKFYSGTYQYSIIFTGTKGSTVCLLYDLNENNKWKGKPLASYTISSEELIHEITISFVVPNLPPGDFLLVGVWVRGEAYLDNIHLEKTD